MEWKLNGSEPVYQQIKEHFRCAILSGHYPPGERIPSVRDLATQARVNPNTMQRALSELEQEGLLLSHGAFGRFVTENQLILQALRQQKIDQTLLQCQKLLADVGLTLAQAAAMTAEKEES